MHQPATAHDAVGIDSSIHNLLPDDEWLPVTGWPLKELGTLAKITDTPSLLVFANRARPRWRQALYLALAIGAFDTADVFLKRSGLDTSGTRDDQLRRIALSLPVWTPGKILTACFDGPPRGLMSILKKFDHEPLRRESYGLLARWHQDHQRDNARCNVLQRMVTLNQGRVDAVETLDPILLTPALDDNRV